VHCLVEQNIDDAEQQTWRMPDFKAFEPRADAGRLRSQSILELDLKHEERWMLPMDDRG